MCEASVPIICMVDDVAMEDGAAPDPLLLLDDFREELAFDEVDVDDAKAAASAFSFSSFISLDTLFF
jgi:hypothetical protein